MLGALALALTASPAPSEFLQARWLDLGSGGCRAAGGGYERRASRGNISSAGQCQKACDADLECTALVIGSDLRGSDAPPLGVASDVEFDSISKQLRCHLLGGGPYTHADGRAGFSCHVREVLCNLPPEAPHGYDLSACEDVSSDTGAAIPPCALRCDTGFAGSPVARCLQHGGVFSLEGCATLRTDRWRLRGQSSCTTLGAPAPFTSQRSASCASCRAVCEAACDTGDCCTAVTCDLSSLRCDLHHIARITDWDPSPTAVSGLRGAAILARECWEFLEAAKILTTSTLPHRSIELNVSSSRIATDVLEL